MATYPHSYTGLYDPDTGPLTGTFTPEAQSAETVSYSVESGMYEVDDTLRVDIFINGAFFTTRNFVAVEFSDQRWLAYDSVAGAFSYFTESAPPTLGQPILISEAGAFFVCFLAGTLIATPQSERAVEDLAIGDLVLTSTGEARPVRWIGRQTVVATFADPLRVYPIRIAAGALGGTLPARDLYVSLDHALLIDGLLVQAGALVNGTTVIRVERPEERFTYYHIELADHALILAEGVPAETFVDHVTHRHFDNYAEYEALYGTADEAIPEMDLPRVKSPRQLPSALRARIEAQAPATLAA